MTDQRIIQLAEKLVNYSCRVQPGERVLIEVFGFEIPLTRELIKQVYRAGGMPFPTIKNNELRRELLACCSEEQLSLMASFELDRMKEMDAYIGIVATDNKCELGDVPAEKLKLYNKVVGKPVTDEKVEHTKWVALRYPNHSMAQLAGMSTEGFEDFFFSVCNLDYAKMSFAMNGLVKLMENTDMVRIKGPDTDLSFSIKGMPAVKCEGRRNLPDGEVYAAPLKDSVNGFITYNVPSQYNGFTYENVRLEFKDGKIVGAAANNNIKINELLDTDEGARYIGEFAFGLNPYIQNPIKDIIFDEKINGSIHFTPGNSYTLSNNGNKSAIHWDLILIQRPEYGGGEIWFDDKLVRRDGVFIPDELLCLNPENLI